MWRSFAGTSAREVWPYEIVVLATDFGRSGWMAGRSCRTYFVDRKVARATRDAVPIVVDEMDRIVWVAGYGIDEAFRVTDPAQAVLILKLKALGGSA